MKLQKLQNRAIRFVHNDFECNSIDLMSKYNMKSIAQCNIYKIAVEMYKCLYNMSPPYVYKLFKKNNGYCSRYINNFVLRCTRTNKYGQRSFSYMGVKICNKLPIKSRMAKELSDFKSSICDINLKDFNELLYGREVSTD